MERGKLIFSIYWTKRKNFNQNLINTSITLNKRVSDTELDNLTKIISKHCEEVKFISLSSTNKESTICFDFHYRSGNCYDFHFRDNSTISI